MKDGPAGPSPDPAERARDAAEARLADLLAAGGASPHPVRSAAYLSARFGAGAEAAPVAAERALEHHDGRLFAERLLAAVGDEVLDERGLDVTAQPIGVDVDGLLVPIGNLDGRRTDVVVCVRDALPWVQRCLWSIVERARTPYGLIVVDDGSALPTRRYLERFAAEHPAVLLLTNLGPRHGRTVAANIGLAASRSEFVALLDSDAAVTSGWLEVLEAAFDEDPRLGVAEPLPTPAGDLPVEAFGTLMARESAEVRAPRAFLEGPCVGVRRQVLDEVGFLDEERFATGYGELDDLCLRARDAGWGVAAIGGMAVLHEGGRSYGPEQREALRARHATRLDLKHGPERVAALREEQAADCSLEPLRERLAAAVRDPASVASWLHGDEPPVEIVFVLPGLAEGGSGGSHSIAQEVRGMRALGIPARIAIAAEHLSRAHGLYPDAAELFFGYEGAEDLAAALRGVDVVSATHFTSIPVLQELVEGGTDVVPAYYVQDYEPFFIRDPASPAMASALRSYTAVPGLVLFAKTHWLCNIVRRAHDVAVSKVEPSLDRAVFHAEGRADAGPDEPLRVAAMVRRRTPRRQPCETVTLLLRLRAVLGDRVRLTTFGCSQEDLLMLPEGDQLAGTHAGVLRREAVADVLRATDLFIDGSMYQAFGRTALEASACGAAVVVPRLGGAAEIVDPGVEGVAVDTLDGGATLGVVLDLLADPPRLRAMGRAGARRAAQRSIERAALSEYLVLRDAVRRRRAGTVASAGR